MITVVGSNAAHHWRPDLWPNPKDIDFILTWEKFQELVSKKGLKATPLGPKNFVSRVNGQMIEFEIAWPDSSGLDFLKKTQDTSEVMEILGEQVLVPNLDWLFTLKDSHKYRKNSPHFSKTRRDWEMFQQILSCEITDKNWLRKREKETYIDERPKLNKKKKEFFTDNITYVYDHDSLHEAMKHLDKPAYSYYKKDGHEVLCDRKKWKQVSEEVRCFGVLEEAYVLALERSQIPYPETDPLISFSIALQKICTSITSGYFRKYAYENYYHILNMFNVNYLEKFENALHSGIVKPFRG